MKTFEAAVLLVLGTVLITFVSVSFVLFARPLSLSNPGLLMECLFVGGLVFVALAVRKLAQINRALA